MATSRTILKGYLKKFSTPTEGQFAELIDSALNIKDDGLEKSAGTPLKIQAGSDGTLQQVVAFYKSFADIDASADWTIQLKAPGTNGASGLAIVKGGGTAPVLFIDEKSGKIGVNTDKPGFELDVNGKARLGKVVIDGNNLSVDMDSGNKLNVNAEIYALKSSIYFTDTEHNHTGIGNTLGYAAIENAKNHNALVILGRTRDSNNGKRAVQIWDILEVKNGPIVPKVGDDENSGIHFPPNSFGGSGDTAFIRYYRKPVKPSNNPMTSNVATETTVLAIRNMNDHDEPFADDVEIQAAGTLRLIGHAITVNGVAASSDKREKTNIEALPYGLNEIRELNPVSYNWKNRPNLKRSIGLIAQEVDAVIQEATHYDENSPSGHGWCLSYNSFIPVLINAIKELDQKVKDLQGKK